MEVPEAWLSESPTIWPLVTAAEDVNVDSYSVLLARVPVTIFVFAPKRVPLGLAFVTVSSRTSTVGDPVAVPEYHTTRSILPVLGARKINPTRPFAVSAVELVTPPTELNGTFPIAIGIVSTIAITAPARLRRVALLRLDLNHLVADCLQHRRTHSTHPHLAKAGLAVVVRASMFRPLA